MTKKLINLTLIFFLLLVGCGSDDGSDMSETPSASGEAPSNQGNNNAPGVLTAAEWNDLENWSFWENIINVNEYKSMPIYWSIFNNNRISIIVNSTNNTPIINAEVKLKNNGNTVFTAKTDNKGRAELWADIFQLNSNVDFSKFTIDINNGLSILNDVKPFSQGINTITLPTTSSIDDKIEISFVVDATGSMGDELEYLKTELLDVISRIKDKNLSSSVYTSSVFYRDEGDEYITRISPFTNNENTTINFIKNQSANGGGDFPEAVHTALDKSVNELQWSANSKTRIIFLLLDAPPHYNSTVLSSLQTSLMKATEKGIKIVPITASGIDKETEFLMRFLSITSNGTYVFITDDSGVGNSHLQPSVGEYQVEFLNNLMVRLINKYAE